MARKSMTGAKLTRLKARTRVLQGTVRLSFVFFCISVGFVVVATAFPQLRSLEKLESNLAMAKKREANVLAEREYHQVEYRALREDPEFLEIHARDRLGYSREGERVLKFRQQK